MSTGDEKLTFDVKIMNEENKNRKRNLSSEVSRGNWGSQWEFLLSCVGLSVGIGNVWRFPYLAYQNGGGAFLIPYLIMLLIAGKPMYFMELAFGQFGGSGTLSVWRCAPIAKGVGVAMLSVAALVTVYYAVVMSYALFYIWSTFQRDLPWNFCDAKWANETNCVVRSQMVNTSGVFKGNSSSQVFWEREVLDLSPGINQLGGIKWDLAICLAITWIVTILCLVKGVKTSGKVVYFAATFPYVILAALLIAGLTQPGAWEGIKYFLIPEWSKLLEIKVWQAAASQMFFSLSVSEGSLIMYSSYNDFRHNIFRDAMIVSVLDTMTSIISGLVIFSVLGAMSFEMKLDMNDVVKSGPGLAFVAYPEALSRLPWPHLWSVLFFFMLFILGLDSTFAMLENIVTSFSDEMNCIRKHKLKITASIGFVLFICGLPVVTRGGQYILELLDYYGGSISLVFIAVFECVSISWIYGYDNFASDVNFMLNKHLGFYWRITWKYTAPITLLFIAIYSLVVHTPLQYGVYRFPNWTDVVGWALVFFVISQIIIWALFHIFRSCRQECCKCLDAVFAPDKDWGPKNPIHREEWRIYKRNLNFSDLELQHTYITNL